jgi:hypothetical protein
VKVIVHQAVGVHLPSRFQATGPERLKESIPIYVVADYLFAPIPTIH